MFGRNWKLPSCDTEDSESVIDDDTLPSEQSIKAALNKIEAGSCKLIADRIVEANSEGKVFTHATDSTTRARTGCYATAGVHINNDEYLPFHTMPMGSESTDNIGDGVITNFELIAAASDYTAAELYEKVDCHMTDSTSHNKGIVVIQK